MNDKSPKYYLICAIIWTVIALAALVLLFMATGSLFGKFCGLLLIFLCLLGQWMRYFRNK